MLPCAERRAAHRRVVGRGRVAACDDLFAAEAVGGTEDGADVELEGGGALRERDEPLRARRRRPARRSPPGRTGGPMARCW